MADLHSPGSPASHSSSARKDAPGFRPERLWWVAAVAATIFLASSRAQVASPGISNFDKIAHFSVYGLLATLVCRSGRGWRGAAAALVAVSLFGATDEWHQSFVPGRSTELADWMADTLGALTAISLYAGWGGYRRMLESPLGARAASRERPAEANLRP